MSEAYLLEVTTPIGEKRRELYHTKNGADQAAAMYARSSEGWKTEAFPLVKAVPQRGGDPCATPRPDCGCDDCVYNRSLPKRGDEVQR